jgi:hypothetical protein
MEFLLSQVSDFSLGVLSVYMNLLGREAERNMRAGRQRS